VSVSVTRALTAALTSSNDINRHESALTGAQGIHTSPSDGQMGCALDTYVYMYMCCTYIYMYTYEFMYICIYMYSYLYVYLYYIYIHTCMTKLYSHQYILRGP